MTIRTKQRQKHERRKRRTRAKITGTADRPRLSVFRSNKYLYVQLIDDVAGETITGANSRAVADKGMMEQAEYLGKEIAKRAKDAGITRVVFDRGGYTYTGRIKQIAESARAAGLIF